MQMAARNTSGKRHVQARALKAPIDEPVATISMSSLSQSARIAGTSSWRMNSRNWRCSHSRCRVLPSPTSSARPFTLSHE